MANKQDRVVRYVWNDEHYDLNLSRLLFAEARQVEKMTGLPLGAAMQASATGSVTAHQAFAFVAIKRRRPQFTVADLDAIPVQDITVEPVAQDPDGDDDVDPSGSSSESSPTGSRRSSSGSGRTRSTSRTGGASGRGSSTT